MSAMTATTSSSRTGIRAIIRRHPLLSVVFLMFTLAWSVMLPVALASLGLLPFWLPQIFELITGWAPGIAAIAVSMVVAGRAGVRDLLGRFLIWRVGVRWYLTGLFLMAAIILGGIALHRLFGGATPRVPSAGAPVWSIGLIAAAMILFGFLFNTEEVAWRGFALPRLQARYGALAAGVLLAIPEVLLHLPLFWTKEIDFYQTVGVFWFSAFSVAAVFIYTYIFNRTKGSLLIVTLLHASQNAWANLLSDNSLRPFVFTVALMWMIVLGLIFLTKGQLGLESEAKEKEG